MRRILIALTMSVCFTVQLQAETAFNERPKLVVGIVVDQMRWDYLGRYYDQFQTDGLKRLITKGYSCDNCPADGDGHRTYQYLYRYDTCLPWYLWKRLLCERREAQQL